jgi:hypothetical protein
MGVNDGTAGVAACGWRERWTCGKRAAVLSLIRKQMSALPVSADIVNRQY